MRDRIRRVVSGALVLGGLWLALGRYFLCDDAFISFRYARNLARGAGLVYNAGERVEGYTNLLWTLLMVPAFPFGIDVRLWSAVWSYAFFAGALALLWLAAERTARDRPLAERPWVSLALAGTVLNHSVLNWASGGLETSLVLCLTVALVALYPAAAAAARSRAAIGLSLAGALLTLARPDGLVLYGVFAVCLLAVRVAGRPIVAALREATAVVLPGAALLGATALGKLAYYGGLLPNTYYAKNAGSAHWEQGLAYLGAFFASYPPLALAVVLPVVAAAVLARAGPGKRLAVVADPAFPSACAGAAFLAYAARVGGDFMEYRLLVPVVPLFYFALERQLLQLVRAAPTVALLGVALLALLMQREVSVLPGERMEARESLAYHIDVHRWDRMGADLAERLPPEAVIATTAAGALPYYYDRRTIDLLGLTDPHIAHLDMDLSREGATIGHCKFPDDAYLLDRGVNFSFAWIRGPESFSQSFPGAPDEVLVRLRGDDALRGRYLARTPALDALLASRPEDFTIVAAVITRPKQFLPPEVSRGGRIVAFVDVGGDPSTGPQSLLDRYGNLVTDEGRWGHEHPVEVPQVDAGEALRLLVRSDFYRDVQLELAIDGRPAGVLAKPMARDGFDYLEIPLAPAPAAGSELRLFSRGIPFAAYAFWWVAEPGI
jgi:arabinofuranosyltransferase